MVERTSYWRRLSASRCATARRQPNDGGGSSSPPQLGVNASAKGLQIPKGWLEERVDELIHLAPIQVAVFVIWGGNDEPSAAQVAHFAAMAKYFQTLEVGFSRDCRLWNLPESWTRKQDNTVASLVAQGVSCKNIDFHFRSLVSAGCKRSSAHFSSS